MSPAKGLACAVNGACGRMGVLLVRLVDADPELTLAAALDVANHPHVGRDAGQIAMLGADLGVALGATLDADVDVMIDFSLPAGTLNVLPMCVEKRVPMVVGTTGFDAEGIGRIEDAAASVPIVFAPNMSVGVNLLFKLVGEVAKTLGSDYDVEIVETHHRLKKDAPSGTALGLAASIEAALDRDLQVDARYGRQGQVGERRKHEIGIHAVRGGDVVGDHTVVFATQGERIELTHRAHSRETFVRGALRAAKWVQGKKPGLYSMREVLGI